MAIFGKKCIRNTQTIIVVEIHQTKLKIFRSNLIALLLYRADIWRMTQADENKFNLFQRICLQILKIHWPVGMSNEWLYNRDYVSSISEDIKI